MKAYLIERALLPKLVKFFSTGMIASARRMKFIIASLFTCLAVMIKKSSQIRRWTAKLLKFIALVGTIIGLVVFAGLLAFKSAFEPQVRKWMETIKMKQTNLKDAKSN